MPDLLPNIIKDSSTGSAGLVAGEIAAEDALLIGEATLTSHNYGSIDPNNTANDANDANDNLSLHGVRSTRSLAESEYALPKSQVYVLVSAIFMASFLSALDGTVVTTLLTVIASELNAVGQISWIATAYLLSCAAFQPLFGKLSDIFGRKPLLLLCCFCFAIGCLICVTNSLVLLVIGRFVTGIGGGGLTALGTITMSDIVPLRQRGLFQGLANVCFGIGAATGGVLGGVVNDWLGWKYVFLLQVPLAILVFIAIWMNLNLPEGLPGLGAYGSDIKLKVKRVDFLGSLLLVSSLMGIMAAASFGGHEIAYSSKTFIGLLSGSLLLLILFVYVELFVLPEPVIPVELLTERTVLLSSLANWFYTMGVFTLLFYIPIYLTSVLSLTATQNGLRLVPNFFGTSFGSVGAGYYMKKTGKYYKLTVLAAIITGFGIINIETMTAEVSTFRQFTLTAIAGAAYSVILTVTLLSLIAAVPIKYQACTTSIQYTFRATGSTLGVSVASAIFQNILVTALIKNVSKAVKDPIKAQHYITKALENATFSKDAPKKVALAIQGSYELACRGAFHFATAVLILGVILSLFMREHVLHSSMNRD